MTINARFLLTALFFGVSFLPVSAAGGQENNYLVFKIQDLSFDSDIRSVEQVLQNSFGLDTSNGINEDFAGLGYKLTEGYTFNRFLNVEGSIFYLDTSKFTVNDGTTSTTVEAEGAGAEFTIQGVYPFSPRFQVFAEGGGLFWRMNWKNRLPADAGRIKIHDDGIEAILGVGMRYLLGRNMLVELEINQTDVNDLDLTTAALGFGFRY
ncbi:Outer membrane beta-barrel protein [Sulfidibacter corallicola]|uniref:Outer membrane beta-barrel protein n=1 Tax=Sulfidibacter corallicola TaxID=2818388 RepID=A0A8A4TFC4_SULCO|nr:outer membrane beta-barrel protein [Sulfidibacter corallicola]QTD48333.1 outer membrane beta-barrel protein [Sulfidibacter corallicola]